MCFLTDRFLDRRRKLYGVSRAQKGRALYATRPRRATFLPTHDDRFSIGSYGSIFKRANRYDKDTCVPATRKGYRVDVLIFLPGLQKSTAVPGQSSFDRIKAIASDMWKVEGFRSFYKGITPRVLRVAPGQAIVFAVYERVSTIMEAMKPSVRAEDKYSE